MAERREELRAADSDRQFVAERLQAALNEGRLTLSEYDERLQQTYAARTYGELDRMLDDLPATITGRGSVVPAQPSPVASAPVAQASAGQAPEAGSRFPHWLQVIWGSWFASVLVCTVVYLITDAGGYFWPVWVAGPWGALLLVRTIAAMGSGDPAGHVAGNQSRDQVRRERHRIRQQRRDLRGR